MASKFLCPTESKMLLTSIQPASEFNNRKKENQKIIFLTIMFLFRACKLVFSAPSLYVVKCKLAIFSFWKVQKCKIFILLITEIKQPACLFYSHQFISDGNRFKLNMYMLSYTLYFFNISTLNCSVALEFLFMIFHLIVF